MQKYIIASAVIAFIIGFIAYGSYREHKGYENGKRDVTLERQVEKINEQKTEIKTTNDIIQTKRIQEKLVSKTSNLSSSDARTKFMQLLFEERDGANNQ